MKTLRAKHVFPRAAMTVMSAVLLTAVMAVSQEAAVMEVGWSSFASSMKDFFYTGLGGTGTTAIGMVIAVIGIVLAAVSFVVHKLNPQSRMPGWIMCLVVALIGTLLFTGVSPVITIVTTIRDTVMGWFGFSGFGTYE